ncbi:MAG TPA: hypothetical protein DCQ92_15880, partial [Verrucomicrobia subdivision 3 bacterium]|nr:hypothetical protein [Limisphaerales bacterium]
MVPLAGSATTNVWNVATTGANPWSTGGNWSPAGPPGSADTALFGVIGTSASSTTVNNVVDANTTITGLSYTNTTSGTWHVTQIPSGTTLTVSGNVVVGGNTANSLVTSAAMTDAGTFVVNGNLTIGNNGSSSADQGTILDLSTLSNFVYNASSGTITMSTGNRSGANFNLAGVSNNITVGTWNHNVASTSSGASGTVTMGAGTNIINVGIFNIGAARESATVTFPATGGLKLRGTGGTDNDRATLVVGNRSSGNSSATSSSGTLSFNGHPIDAKVSTLTLGENTQNSNGSLTENGIFSFNQGTFDATTINMAVISSGNTQAGSIANATITVGGGTLIVGTGGLSLVNLAGTGAGDVATGNLNILGGTVTCAGSITKTTAAGTGNISISSGFLTVAGTIGSASIPVDSLNLTNGTLTLPAAASASATVTNLNSGGTTNMISVSSVAAITVYPTQFPLIKYTTSSGDLTIIGLGTLPGIFQGYISNNTANLSIDVVFTGGPPPVQTGHLGRHSQRQLGHHHGELEERAALQPERL